MIRNVGCGVFESRLLFFCITRIGEAIGPHTGTKRSAIIDPTAIIKKAQKSRREQGKKPKQHAQAVCHCATVSLKPTLCQQHHEPEPYNNRLELRRRQVRRVVRVVRLQLRKVPLKRNGVGLGGRQQNSVLKGLAYRIKKNKQKKKKNDQATPTLREDHP
jgi:hypothetical protein